MSETHTGERILLVGAGAVGQVYGYHLAKGGAKVTYLVKEKYFDRVEQGFLLHRHRLLRRPKSFEFHDFDVLVDHREVAEREWDQVWLCVSATAIFGDWLEDLAGCIGDATLVSLQPGFKGQKRIESVYEPAKVVSGLITLIAYQAPLQGEDLLPGVAYLLPPMAPIPFAGEPGRVEKVALALDSGGCPATIDQDTPKTASFGTAVMVPAIAGLEAAGWSLSRFRRTPALEISTAASKEALKIMGLYYWTKVPFLAKFIRRPELLGVGLSVAPTLLPFDLETYLEYHFTKVGDQTRKIIDDYIRLGQDQQNSTRALQVLRRLLEGQVEPVALSSERAAHIEL